MLQKNYIYGIAEKSLQQYQLEGGNMMIISVVVISIITKCQTIITFNTNSSDELQWLPTDAISSQKVGVDKLIRICPNSWQNILHKSMS
jgi:hypothetical protein